MKAYPRDFSFYAHSHGGHASKYHLMGNDLASKCGRARMLNTDDAIELENVPEILRCRACFPAPRPGPGAADEAEL